MTRRGEKMQEEVLAILRRRGVPMSAYDVLAEMRENNPKIAPPTIYRALSALTARGRVHRLESMNAFVACQCDGNHDGAHHASVLSICDDCGVVEESVAPKLLDDISAISGKSGFQPARHVIEVHGRCASCGDSGGAAMMGRWSSFHLLLLGAGPRLAVAALVVALLWAGFFWATAPLGAF